MTDSIYTRIRTTTTKKKLPPDQYSKECINEQGQKFPFKKTDFARLIHSCKNWQVLEGNKLLQSQNVLAQNSYKLSGLRGRNSLETYSKTIFQRNEIKIMKYIYRYMCIN